MTKSGAVKRIRKASPKTALVVFGAELKRARETRHLSLGQVAQRVTPFGASISRSELFQLEQGIRPRPDALLVLALAAIYGLDHVRLLDVLRWNRAYPAATSLPSNWAIEEVGMTVIGHEQHMVRTFRSLNNEQQQYVLDQIEFAKTRVGKKTGAADTEAPFRGRGGPKR